MLKVCKCEYIVRREILVVKGKFVLLSQEMMNELRKKREKEKEKEKEKSRKKKQKQKFVAIRLGVQRIKLRGVWGTLSFLEEIFVYE